MMYRSCELLVAMSAASPLQCEELRGAVPSRYHKGDAGIFSRILKAIDEMLVHVLLCAAGGIWAVELFVSEILPSHLPAMITRTSSMAVRSSRIKSFSSSRSASK